MCRFRCVLTRRRNEAIVIPERHQRLAQIPQVVLQCARYCFRLRQIRVRLIVEELQPLLVSLSPVHAQADQLRDFRVHTADAVQALLLQAAVLQHLDALAGEREAHVIQGVLVVRLQGARHQVRGLLAVHGVQPHLAVLLAQCLKGERHVGLLLERQIEAVALLELGGATRALRQRQAFAVDLGAPGHLVVRLHGELFLLLLVGAVVLGPGGGERLCGDRSESVSDEPGGSGSHSHQLTQLALLHQEQVALLRELGVRLHFAVHVLGFQFLGLRLRLVKVLARLLHLVLQIGHVLARLDGGVVAPVVEDHPAGHEAEQRFDELELDALLHVLNGQYVAEGLAQVFALQHAQTGVRLRNGGKRNHVFFFQKSKESWR